jgi:hypothetical protein
VVIVTDKDSNIVRASKDNIGKPRYCFIVFTILSHSFHICNIIDSIMRSLRENELTYRTEKYCRYCTDARVFESYLTLYYYDSVGEDVYLFAYFQQMKMCY